jgi:HAD superfamily hydrolase (TIGR01549 family)
MITPKERWDDQCPEATSRSTAVRPSTLAVLGSPIGELQRSGLGEPESYRLHLPDRATELLRRPPLRPRAPHRARGRTALPAGRRPLRQPPPAHHALANRAHAFDIPAPSDLGNHPERKIAIPTLGRQGQAPGDDPPMVDVVFFDLDGTLVDHRGAVLEAIGQIVRAAPNATVPPDELVTFWWTLEGRHMQEYLAGQCSFAEQHRRRLRSFLPMLGEPVPESPGLLDAWFAERYLTVFEESWRSYPDVQPCLETLKRLPRGPRLAVLTNGDPEQQRAKLARFGLLEYFEAVLTPTELGAAKPDPVAFATACQRMRTDPVQAVNVGDMLEGDVNAAALAGLTGIWLDRGIDFITGGPPPTADETVLRIERLTDLPDQLSRTNA